MNTLVKVSLGAVVVAGAVAGFVAYGNYKSNATDANEEVSSPAKDTEASTESE